jgi:hypothetical protein
MITCIINFPSQDRGEWRILQNLVPATEPGLNLQLALRVVAISIVYIYLGHQVSNATMHYRFCQVGMD